jgi:hypothetical protein
MWSEPNAMIIDEWEQAAHVLSALPFLGFPMSESRVKFALENRGMSESGRHTTTAQSSEFCRSLQFLAQQVSLDFGSLPVSD